MVNNCFLINFLKLEMDQLFKVKEAYENNTISEDIFELIKKDCTSHAGCSTLFWN